MPSPARRFATGCLIVFMLPFFIGGLFSLVTGIRLLVRFGPAMESLLPLGFGAVFVGVSTLIFSAAMFGLRGAAETAGLMSQYPEKPWMWRKDWSEGAAVSHGGAMSWTLAVFALAWNAIASPAAWIVFDRGIYKQSPVVLAVFLFPLIGVFLFLTAAYQLLRAYKYGQSRVMLPHVPIATGATLRGEIVTHVKDRPENGFQLKLACVQRVVTGSGKSRTITESEIWRDEQHVSPSSLIPTMDGVRVPFAFSIPADARSTDLSISADQVMWRLDAAAETFGIDYAARFDLPVFRTGETPHEEHRFAPAAGDVVSWRPSDPSKISIAPLPEGGDDIRIGTHAKLLETLPLLIFVAVWCGAVWLMIRENVPRFVPGIFAFIGFFMVVGLIDSVIGRTRIRADQKGLAVRHSWLGLAFTRRIAKDQIAGILANATSGSRYYQIDVVKTGGSNDVVASYIADRKDAETLAARLLHAIGS